ncbi:MAG: glycosyl transferase [Marinilabiliales bacterium]|nr:MAG: glycosyl transferase [Marinilabiliales bacterium]
MKIAYLSTFYPFRGGIAQFNALLTEALRAEGHEVKAFTFSRQYPKMLFPGKTQMVSENDDAIKIGAERILDTANPLNWGKTARTIRKFEPDLLIMKYWMSYFGPSLGSVAKRLKKDCKIITVLDNVIPHEKKFYDMPATRYFLKQNHAFISMSKSVEADLLSILPDVKSVFSPHPVYNHFGMRISKEEACRQLNIPSNKKTVLFFGFIRKYKGLDNLINSFSMLDDSYQLLIAGESYSDFDEYQRLIDGNSNENIHPHIRYIDDNEVPAFFSAAEVLVLPYKSATQSGISGIALHFRLPQIVSNVGGLVEYVEHEKTGLIIENLTPENLAEGLKRYFDNNLKEKFESNIEEISDKYSWETLARTIVELSESLETKTR